MPPEIAQILIAFAIGIAVMILFAEPA